MSDALFYMQLASYNTAYNFDVIAQRIDEKRINWGMVTSPVDPRNPDYSDFYSLDSGIFGISISSQHQKEAEEFIRFIMNDSAFYKSNPDHLLQYGLPTRIDLIKRIDGHDLSPLYMLKPAMNTVNPYDEVNYKIINAFKDASEKIIDQAIKGDISTDRAMILVEEEGQKAVDAEKMKIGLPN